MHACMVNMFSFLWSLCPYHLSSSVLLPEPMPQRPATHTRAQPTRAFRPPRARMTERPRPRKSGTVPFPSQRRWLMAVMHYHGSYYLLPWLAIMHHAPASITSFMTVCACSQPGPSRHKGGSGGRREGKGGAAPQVGWLDDSQVNLTAEVNAEHFSFSPLSARFEMKGFLAGDHGDRSWIMRGLTTNGTRGMNKNKWWGYFSWLYDYRECYVISLLELLFRYPFRDIFSLFCRHFLW